MFIIIFVFYEIFNFLFYSMASIALDIILIKKLKKTLDEKKKKSSKKGSFLLNDGIMMVLINAFVNIFIRLPELLSVIFSGYASLSGPNSWFNMSICSYVDFCQYSKD